MFDLNDQDTGSVQKHAYRSPIPNGPDPAPATANQLDSARMGDLHHRLLDLYTVEMDKQHDNRLEMAIDEDFYDNIQWDPNDEAELEARGQKAIVYNVIATSVNWVLGTEKRARTDHKVLPRRKTEAKPAERKSQLLKYLSDVNRSPFERSRAFADSVKVGLGWLEDGVRDDDEGEPIYNQYESWRNVLHDSSATRLDLEDGRYIFRAKWVDLDIACAMWPARAELLRRSARDSYDYVARDTYGDEAMDQQEETLWTASGTGNTERTWGYQRQRVRIIEGWIKMPVHTQRLRGGAFDREIYDAYSPGHADSLLSGEARLVKKVQMRMHVAIFTSSGMLWFSKSPYRHNRFPLTPIWGNKRGRDGLPYGMIRGLRGMQEDINKRASKALAILSTNKVIMDEGALPEGTDLEEFAAEVARPDAILMKRKGYEMRLEVDRDLSQWHLELMSRTIQMVQATSGVTDENLGRKTNAASGKAIIARQDQGSLATTIYFDNLHLASQLTGEKKLSLIEQFMSEKKAFRITNTRGAPEYIEVNDGLPENDIVRSKADYVITEADWQASQRQAAVAELLELMQTLPPQVAMTMLDLLVENMDIPFRDELVKRIRQVTGMSDPDAEEMTPEQQAAAEAQAKQQQLAEATAAAQLRKLLGEAQRAEAQAREIVTRLVGTNVDAQNKALAAAREAMMTPGAVPVADHILAESGFVSASDQRGAAAPSPAAPPALPMPPPTPQPGAPPALMPAGA